MAAPIQMSSQASSSASGRQDASAVFGDMNISFGSGSVSAGLSLNDALPFVAIALLGLWMFKRSKR